MTSDNILVAIKSRPFITREKNEKLKPQWSIQQKAIFQTDEASHRIGEPYSFDHIFTEDATNIEVYNAVVKPLIKFCVKGFNSTVFAYGQTSSGKTHTMMGNDSMTGIMQIAVNDVFSLIEQDNQRRYLISCSYLELYNEKINDLLDKNGKDLRVREDYNGNTFVNAKEEVVTVPAQVYELMNLGNKIRKIGCTNLNDRSSRSHTIFRITIESTENDIENGPVQISQLNLVDLAGSERISQTKAEGKQLQEGVNINKSLSVLGNVIRQLSDAERYINYRDSKLTRLLQHALGGNAKSLIIATITLAAGEETKSTLEFAQRAKAIKNKPVINEILSEHDKLKKYESVTAGYKERLEKEKLRIKEMEQEKIEREKEIQKLKQQFKLFDLFTRGPQVKKTHSKIPRRHTVGHYGSRLDTIPELSVLPSTYETKLTEELGYDSDVEEVILRAVQNSDEHFMRTLLEEALDTAFASCPELMEDTVCEQGATSPEPLHESTCLPQLDVTPPSFLRKRLRSLEESYTSLKEFTKLEAEYKEKDKDRVHDLIREKELLLKDWSDLNEMYILERQEKEKLKLKYEDQLESLKTHLEHQLSENNALAFRLGEVESEHDLLKVARERDLMDQRFLLEDRIRNYENQLSYLREEIQRINKQRPTDTQDNLEAQTLQQQIRILEEENSLLNQDIISQYEEKIEQLEQKISEYEQAQGEVDILSKLYLLQDILLAANNDVQGISTEMKKIGMETEDVIKDDIKKTREEADMQREIDLLKEEIKSLQLNKEQEVKVLQEKISTLEKNSEDYKKEAKKELQIKLNNSLHIVENLNEKLMSEMESNSSLNEEKEVYIREVNTLNELLSLDDEETVLGLIEEHQALLDLYENELKVDMQQVATDCSTEIDQFVAYLFELRNITHDLDLQDEIDLTLLKIQGGAENFVNVLEEFAKRLSDNDSPTYTDSTEKLNNLSLFVREKFNYMTYTELQNKALQAKIYKQIQYLEYLDNILSRFSNNRRKDNSIKELENQVQKLAQQNTEDIEKYGKEIIELDTAISELKIEHDELKCALEQKTSEDSNRVKALERNNNNLTEENLSLKEQVNGLQSLITKLSLDRDELRHHLENRTEDLTGENESLRIEINELVLSITKLSLECDNLRLLLEEKAKEDCKDLKNTIKDLEKNINSLTDENTSLNRQFHGLESTMVKLTLERNELKNQLEGKIEEKRNEIVILEKNIKDLTDENTSLMNKVNGLESTVAELNFERNALRHQLEEKTEEERNKVNVVKNLEEHVKDLTDENASLAKKVDELESTIANLRYDDIEERTEEKSYKDFEDTITDLEYKIKVLTDENASLKTEVNGMEATIAELRHNLEENTEEECDKVKNLETNIKDLIYENEGLTKKVIGLESVVAKLSLESDEHRLEQNTTEETIHNLEVYIKNLTDENIHLKNEVKIQGSTVAELRFVRDELMHSLQEKIRELCQKEYEGSKGRDLETYIKELTEENDNLKQSIENIQTSSAAEIEEEKTRSRELNEQLKNLYLENVSLTTKIFDLENIVKDLKSTETIEVLKKTSSTNLSSKEMRKIKRQSLHDQRRGIDSQEYANGDENPVDVNDTEKELLRDTIIKLNAQIEDLIKENNFLEFEVQGFIEEMDSCKRKCEERDIQIEELQKKIKEGNVEIEKKQKDCTKCQLLKKCIKQLEDRLKKNMFKTVELQTKIYDLKSTSEVEKINHEEKNRLLSYQISTLEKQLGTKPPIQVRHTEIQCDLMDYEALRIKYSNLKKLARMRRDEGNILRIKLGMQPDEPVG